MNEETGQQPKDISLRQQGAWLLFAKIIGFFLSTLLPFLVVRILSKEEVGIYQLVFLVIVNSMAILPFGFNMSVYYFLARESERRAPAITNILLFKTVIGGVAALTLYLFPGLLGAIFKDAEITRLAPMIGIVIWLWLFSSFLEIVPVANQEPRMATVFIVMAQFTKTLLMVAAVVIFSTIEAFIYAAAIQGAIQTIILLFYLRSRFPGYWKKFDLGFFREHLIYALPFGMSALLWIMQMDIHRYFVGSSFTKEEYATYAIGCFQLPLLTLMVESVTSVMIPRMSKLQAEGNRREMIFLSARAVQKLSFFLFPMIAFLFLTAQVFIVTLYTRNYESSVPIFLLNLLVWPFYVLVTDPIARAYEDLGRTMLILRVIAFIIFVALLFYGVQHFSLLGMMGIVVAIAIIDRVTQAFFAFRKIGVKVTDIYLLKNVVKTAVVSSMAVLLTYFVFRFTKNYTPAIGDTISHIFFSAPKTSVIDFISGSLTLGISGLFFVPIYLLGMNYWNAIDEEEKAVINRLIDRGKGVFAKKTEKAIDINLAGESKL